MENLLRLLNPKTTNFDGVSGGSYGALTAADVCIAMSYAKLTPMQDNLFRMKCLGANTINNIETLSAVLLNSIDCLLGNHNLETKYHSTVIKVALIEFCLVSSDYKPSNRNRAVFAGVSFETVRTLLAKHIHKIKVYFMSEFRIAELKIESQLKKAI